VNAAEILALAGHLELVRKPLIGAEGCQVNALKQSAIKSEEMKPMLGFEQWSTLADAT
jgi:hypothetical protein